MRFIITTETKTGERVIYREKEECLKRLSQMIDRYAKLCKYTGKKHLDINLEWIPIIEDENKSGENLFLESHYSSCEELLVAISQMIDKYLPQNKGYFEISLNIPRFTFLHIVNKEDYRKVKESGQKELRMMDSFETLEEYLSSSHLPADKRTEAATIIQQLKNILIQNYSG